VSAASAGALWRPRRVLYLGTPEMAVAPLEALVGAGFDVVGAVTRADKRRGRGGEPTPSAVKRAAVSLGIDVVHSVDEGIDLATKRDAEVGVVVAFGQLVKPQALAALPMVNLHFSLLPRWRGAAPVERALLAGDVETGVSLMRLDEGLDTGPVYARIETPIGASDTGGSLRDRLVALGTELLVRELSSGLGEPTQQVGEHTYASKLSALDLKLDWSRSAIERDRLIRLGGAWTTLRGKRLKVLHAELVDPDARGNALVDDLVGGLRLSLVHPEGKPAMEFMAFANGARLARGEELGTD
jgi:methionyl-tRNA formyltransferase